MVEAVHADLVAASGDGAREVRGREPRSARMKKVAQAPRRSSRSRTPGVTTGCGPSSKVTPKTGASVSTPRTEPTARRPIRVRANRRRPAATGLPLSGAPGRDTSCVEFPGPEFAPPSTARVI